MTSQAFQRALSCTGYLTVDGHAAPGLLRANDEAAARLRVVMRNTKVGLNADAVFTTQSTPAAIFKDAGDKNPTDEEVRNWHEAAWNIGVAPLLWIITPTEIRLYDCYASPVQVGDQRKTKPIGQFDLASDESLNALDAMCGRLATETGAFWSSSLGKCIDRRHRVDRELLKEINALEERLTAIAPFNGPTELSTKLEVKTARDFAQRLIGRCIFTWYLMDRNIAQQFLPADLNIGLSNMFSSPSQAFQLFEWLRRTFNGDLFPMNDPGAEQTRLGPQHLLLLQDFIEGRSLVEGNEGQGRLFRFRFDAIPVDLISSIYQQFARSSAEDEARIFGLHYTPMELVHLTLDPVFEGLPAAARIIDPTCGSGAFLVEAFRRLVWKNCGDKPASRALVRSILYNQLFGIDINRSALGIAAFSLYLAALEFDEDPIADVNDLKFDRLIGSSLFETDTIGDQLPDKLTSLAFDAVVGNPPWTFDTAQKAKPRKNGEAGTSRPRRSPDQAFLNVAAKFAGDSGRIGMVMKATPFFSKDKHALAARNDLLARIYPAAIINLSALRKEELFPDASGPALLFFARCVLMPNGENLLVGSVPWTPNFLRSGVFHVGPGELRTVPLARVLRTPSVLKAATFGTVRDSWLIERLEREYPTLETVLDGEGQPSATRGQGYQVKGSAAEPPKEFYSLKALTPINYSAFRLDDTQLELFSHKTVHRARDIAIYKGPLLLCPKGSSTSAAELGRYSAAVYKENLLYSESFFGISFADRDPRLAYILSGILNSSLTSFQFAFGGGAWGLERSTVEPKDLLSLRIPNIENVDDERLERIREAEAIAAQYPSPNTLDELDDAVGVLYELERDEMILAKESVQRARMLLFEGRSERKLHVKPPQRQILIGYANSIVTVINAYLRARGERHLEATLYTRALVSAEWNEGQAGLTAVRFNMADGPPGKDPIVRIAEGQDDLTALANRIRGRLQADLPPYLNERRQLRLYLENDLYIVKPSEQRYWSRTSGLNDADIILADHWLGRPHVVHA